MNTAGGRPSIKSKKTNSAQKVEKAEKNTAILTKKSTKTTKKKTTSTKKKPQSRKNTKAADLSEEQRRDKAIQNEVKRLTATLKGISAEKRRAAKATIEDAAFLTVSMQELRRQITREGMQVEYKNGENQYGTKQSPAVLNYLAMSAKLTAATKILLECLPKTEQKVVDDKFDEFIVERGDD